MRVLLTAAAVVVGLGALAGLLTVFAFNFLTLAPGRRYGPDLYAGMAVNLLARLVVIGLGYALLRRLWA